MKKMIVLAAAAFLALSGTAFANGLVGDCYDCHTMHNSEQGQGVLKLGAGGATTTGTPMANLLKFDCMACHANNPTSGPMIMPMSGGSNVPQVAHGGADLANSLAGGNFSFGMAAQGGTSRKVHNVNDLFAGQWDNNTGAYNEPPGLYHTADRTAFTPNDGPNAGQAFGDFTCAGARGCHGTRNQVLAIAEDNGTNNVFGAAKRVGIAAVSGAHHINSDGAKNATNYATATVHQGAKVAEGYRFIVGLKGYENETDRWQNKDATSHNEYYGVAGGLNAASCGTCHISGTTTAPNGELNVTGLNSRFTYNSTIITPNSSMSGFCASCHSNFHASGTSTHSDTADNGVAGAFLRHPSDYVIKNEGEYGLYTAYDVTAPVARPSLASAVSSSVSPGTDMVMCLSCHVPHGSPYDYLLRFDYSDMTAGDGSTQADGGCMACHSLKGVAR